MRTVEAFIAILLVTTLSALPQNFTNGPWVYRLNATNGAKIVRSIGSSGTVVFPPSLGGFPVVQLGEGSPPIFGFENRSVTAVEIPDTVTIIGNDSFFSASGLTNVTIPRSVQSIGMHAFSRCTNLVSANIGEGVTNISDFAFELCSALRRVEGGSAVRFIGNNAFTSCGSLTNFTFADSVQNIGIAAFQRRASLTNVVLGRSLQTIGMFAFSSCSNLTTVVLPASLVDVGGNSFSDCPKLRSVVFLGEPPSITVNDFSSATLFRLPKAVGWGQTFAGRPVEIFKLAAGSSAYAPITGLAFSWSNNADAPMNILRAASVDGPWTIISSNAAAGTFKDSNPPAGRAFYRAALP
jgi:hypothetical protein